jgi:hypothetical protein
MDYWILKAEKDHELAKEVREYIRKGWVPQGGVATDGIWFYQAVVKAAGADAASHAVESD